MILTLPVTVEVLVSEHSALKERISQLVTAASEGTGDGAEIPALTREAAALAGRIKEAKANDAREESERRARLRERQRLRFEEVLIECAEAREKFVAAFRDACLALGAYCTALPEAQALQGELLVSFGPENTFAMPLDRNRLTELAQLRDPLAAILDNGELETVKGFGWNLSFGVVPCVNRIEQNLKKEAAK